MVTVGIGWFLVLYFLFRSQHKAEQEECMQRNEGHCDYYPLAPVLEAITVWGMSVIAVGVVALVLTAGTR